MSILRSLTSIAFNGASCRALLKVWSQNCVRTIVKAGLELVEAWSTFRLRFQPKGHSLGLRTQLAEKIKSLTDRGQADVVTCVYQSVEQSFVDPENVLIYNVGPSAFSKIASHGIRFERVTQHPPPCPQPLPPPGALHYASYRLGAPTAEFTHWKRGKPIALWVDAAWPVQAGTSPTPFWLAVRQVNPQLINAAGHRTTLLGLRVTVTGGDRSIGPATLIKPIFDAAISALHVHDNPVARTAAIDRLVSSGQGDFAALERLLTDARFDLLGPRNLLSAYRDGVKWNPEDERCVAGELRWAPGDAMRVMAVEDDPDTRLFYERFLRDEGHEPVLARDGLEAMSRMDPCPDLILLDLGLPTIDGYEVLRLLKSSAETREIPASSCPGARSPTASSFPGSWGSCASPTTCLCWRKPSVGPPQNASGGRARRQSAFTDELVHPLIPD